MGLVRHGCVFMRMRGTKVHSYSKWAFAIEKEANKPAIPAQDGDKWRFYFGTEGAGAYPLAIIGRKENILACLKDSRGVRFTIKSQKMIDDEDEDYFDESLQWPKDTRDATAGMTIHVKAEYLQERKPLEIRDVRMDVMKNVVLNVATAGLFVEVGPINEALNTARDVVSLAVEQGQKPRKPRGHLALVISMLNLGGSIDTRKRSIAAHSLRHSAAQAFARLGV